MIMIAFVWFSFGGDGDCLVESVASARRVYGQDVPVCVFDDDRAPLSPHVVQMVRPTLYERTAWDRGGNLRGPICITGILDCMRRVAEITRADWISKIDCDTILIRPWVQDDLRWAYQGVSWGTQQLGAGLNYALRRDVPDRILRMIAGRPGLFKEASCPEDNTIALFATVCCPGATLIHDSAVGAPGQRLASGWIYGETPTMAEDCRGYSIVTFGNRFTMDDLDTEERNGSRARTRVAVTMAQFNRWIRANLDI